MKKMKKKPITLLEIMIVIFLIGLIGSVIGYNMKGSLDEGRAFKSEQGIARIKEILGLEIANGASAQAVVENPKEFLEHSGLVKDATKTLKDGWGNDYIITAKASGDVSVVSAKLNAFKKAKKQKLNKNKNIETEDSLEEDDES